MNLTVKSVSPTARDWGSKYPDACSVKVWFDDGTCGEYNTKKDKAQSHIDALTALVGKPGEFEVTREREYDGVTERTFKAYPGKAESKSFGGSKGNYVPAFHQTAEGVFYEQERMDRRTAVISACAFCGTANGSDLNYVDVANDLYQWLRATCPSVPVSTPNAQLPASTPKTSPVASEGLVPTREGPQQFHPANGKARNDGPGQCSSCFAPSGAFHGSKCTVGAQTAHEED